MGPQTVIMYMKMSHRMCAAVFTGFVCHSLLIFVWGDSGVIQMRHLQRDRDRLESNILRLEEIHLELVVERDALLYDETEIELRSRSLGYLRPGETAISLPSVRGRDTAHTLGSFVRRIDPKKRNHALFRVLALAVGAMAFIISFIPYRNGKNTQ